MHRQAYLLGLLFLASCLGAKHQALFEASGDSDPSSAAGASAGTSFGASSGTDSGSGAQASGAASSTAATGATGGAGSVAGSGAAAGGGTGGAPSLDRPKITDCSMVEGASVGESGHCYRVNEAELDFSAARAACDAAGGHLVTIGSQAENDLCEALHDGEHWIGATDGLADTMAGVGTYTWVGDEAWSFTDWEDGQPNAFETDCPNEDDEADCFEHCAFQSDEGDWNDRSCWHTIVSICEWDVEAAPPAGTDGGAGGAGGAAGEAPATEPDPEPDT